MVLYRSFLLAMLLTLMGCASSPKLGYPVAASIEWVEPEDQTFPASAPSAFNAKRGYLVVSEDHRERSGSVVRLPFVVIQAKNDGGQPPVLRLAGGPGLSGLNAASYPGAYPWTEDRDFIILGQRGTQGAEPVLQCTEYLEAKSHESRKEAVLTCRQRYSDQRIDLSTYHSASSARDIEALRSALGHETLSLYGGSYGTRLALTYARDYRNRVASMVLDSPLPHTVSYDDESPQNLRDVLQGVALACAAQAECDQAYPDLFKRFTAGLDEAKANPWKYKKSGGEQRTASDADLVRTVWIGSSRDLAKVPKTMDSIARRDPRPSVQRLLWGPGRPTAFAWGMRLSFWCSEALPFSERMNGVPDESFASLDGAVVSPEVCQIWDVPKRPEAEKAATVSPVPTLIMSGEFDVLTPPRWGDEVAKTLPNSLAVTIPYGFHSETTNWGGDGCAMRIAAAFFKDERAFLDAPERATACLKDRQPPAFE